MGDWLSHNTGTVVSVLAMLVAMVIAWATNSSRITQLEKENERSSREFKELGQVVDRHRGDTSLHIDPRRDQRMWDDLKNEMRAGFERIEKKIELQMVYTPPPGS